MSPDPDEGHAHAVRSHSGVKRVSLSGSWSWGSANTGQATCWIRVSSWAGAVRGEWRAEQQVVGWLPRGLGREPDSQESDFPSRVGKARVFLLLFIFFQEATWRSAEMSGRGTPANLSGHRTEERTRSLPPAGRAGGLSSGAGPPSPPPCQVCRGAPPPAEGMPANRPLPARAGGSIFPKVEQNPAPFLELFWNSEKKRVMIPLFLP